MLAIPVVVRNGASVLLAPQDLVATNEPLELSTNTANPTTITAEQLVEADFLFSNPATPEDIVLLPSAEDIIAQLILVDNESCNGCLGGQIVNTTVWAQHEPLVSSCGGCPGQSARLAEGTSFRRTFYRNTFGFTTPLYLEIPPTGTPGLTWDDTLENIGEDAEISPRDAVLFINQEWKTLLFRILNSSPTQSLVGDATIGSAIIEADPELITSATVGMRFYTSDDTVFVSSEGQLTVTEINYFSGEITVSGNAVSTLANLSFALTPHIQIIPVLWGVDGSEVETTIVETIDAHRPQWLSFAFNQAAVLSDGDEFVFHLPKGTINAIYVGLKTPSDTGEVEFDVTKNGVSILSTLITVDEDEDGSWDAATPPVIDDPDNDQWDRFVLECTDSGANAFGPIVYVDHLFTPD